MNMMGFPSCSEVPLNTHSQSDTQACTNMKPTHHTNHSTIHKPSMYPPVHYFLAAFSLSQCLNLLELFSPLLCPSPPPSYPTFSRQMVGTSSLAVGVLWWRERGGEMGGGGCPCLCLSGVGLPLHCPNGPSRHSWLALVLHRARESGVSGSHYSACEWVPCPLLSTF